MDAVAASALEIDGISLSFGGNRVLNDVSFPVEAGSITAIIGPNGAGKSSLLNVITGVYTPEAGRVTLRDRGADVDVLALKPYELLRHGVARTFQNLELVPGMTALDNVLVGRHLRLRAPQLNSMLRLPRAMREEREHRQTCLETLEFLGIGDIAHHEIQGLPYGVQKRVELARALVTRPSMLLLDEPAAGLNDEETSEMADIMRLVRDTGECTQVIIEHDMKLIMSVADAIVVLNFGTMLTRGSAQEVSAHPDVIEAYLGSQATASEL